MKSICITGMIQSNLQIVANILQQAGMKQPKPTKRDSYPVGIEFWHEQVLGISSGDSSDTQLKLNPGRVWEHVASDIFFANHKSKIWGWADSRSTQLLDFWLNFDPNLNFILVCISPPQMLASVIATETGTISVEKVMIAWQMHHQELLRFHHRNPQRSLLVDFDECVSSPQNLIKHCTKQWALTLSTIPAAADAAITHDSLRLYLAQQWSQDFPKIVSLQHELAATITHLDETNQITNTITPTFTQFIADYRTLCDRSAELQQVESAREELAALKTQFNDVRASYEKQQKDDTVRFNEATQENELLLLQLHQVQEELEHYFLQHNNLQDKLKIAEDRWQRMFKRKPGYYDYESIEILSVKNCESYITDWRIRNFEINGQSLANLTFRTIIEYGTAGFIFVQQSDTTYPFIRWPGKVVNRNELILIPTGTHANTPKRIEMLHELATRDWIFLQTLIQLLTSVLDAPALLKAPAGFQPKTLLDSLNKLSKSIETLPPTLRYDDVSLKREQVNPDYEHLWLHFDNLALGKKHWPEFEFRLSCANVRPNHFGTHPKLEFPEESGQAPFEAWFAESYDDFGAKLEMRFATPDAMDLAIWQRLARNDQNFFIALIDRLPTILNAMQDANIQLQRPWDDWIEMASAVKHIVTLRNVLPPKTDKQPQILETNLPQSSLPAKTSKTPKAKSETRTMSTRPVRNKRISKAE